MGRLANIVRQTDEAFALCSSAYSEACEQSGNAQSADAGPGAIRLCAEQAKTRVLLVGSVPPPLGGVTVHITRLAAALASRGYVVGLLDESRELKEQIPNIRTISLYDYIALLRDADIVHTHSSNPLIRLAHIAIARVLGRQVVITIHSAKSNFLGRAMYRLACGLSHRSIPVSEEIRQSLRLKGEPIPAFLPPAPAEEIVPQEVADWIADRRREGRKIVVSNASYMRVSDGEDLYGLDLLVDSFAQPQVSRSYALLFVVATLRFGAERYRAMEKQIEQRGLGSVIKLVNLDAPFAGIIANSDVVVRATNTDGDALTVREGLWYGKRVIASDCVKRPEGTVLFRTRDVDDLVSKLIDEGREAPPNTPPRDFVDDLETVYRSCLKAQGGEEKIGASQPGEQKRKILVISQFYAPDITAAAFRISETVGLLRQDADVRVITAVPHKAQAEAANPSDDTGVVRVSIRPYQGGGAFNYIMHYLSFVLTAIWAGIQLKRSGWRPDIIWVSSPPLFVGIAGDVLRRIMGCPLVLDIRDIWPESAVGAKMISQDGLLFRLGKVLERWLYARADRLTCVSKAMQGYLAEASGKTVHVVYNGILKRAPQAPAQHVQRRILYAGNLGRAQGLDVLIAAFADARKLSKELAGWTVAFIGAGAIEDALRASVAELNLGEEIRFLGVLDKPSAMAEMRQSAALFINLLSEAVFALTVPSKVFDCMLAGRPILYGVDNPEARAILSESGGNIEFTANDQSSLTDAIVDLATRLNQIERLAQGNSDVVLGQYTREEATHELRSALEAAADEPRPTFLQKLGSKFEDTRRDIARQLAFARHVPVQRMLRRGVLTLKRKWLQRFPPAALTVPNDIELNSAPAAPLMPPRYGPTVVDDGRITLKLLGKTDTLSLPISWRNPHQDRETQLWWMTLNYMQYLEGTSDELFASVVESWLSSAHPYAKEYWRDTFNSYAVSIRTVVWMQQLAIRPELPSSLRYRIADSIAAQLHFLENNLETDLGGNHLVKNIKALLLGSVFFKGAAARRWRQRGLRLLARELPHQVLRDGVHFERSLSYHNQVFVDLLEIRHALGADPLDGQLDMSLAAMAQVISDLAHGDGRPAQFNDCGLDMSYSSAECLQAYEEVFASRPSGRPVFALRDAGYFGLRAGDSLLVADCGPIGPDDLPGHGHADILSFEWSVAGKRLIVDQGVYEYVAGDCRTAARSVRSHNTLSIAGLDQADFFGDFRVGRRARPEVLRFETTGDGLVLEGRHDGYAPLLHTRRFEVTANQVNVIDWVDGGPASGSVVGLLLHPDARPSVLEDGIRIAIDGHSVMLRASVPFAMEPAVWWPDLGIELPTTRLVARWPDGCKTGSFNLLLER